MKMKKGFTMIEVLIVVVILAVLAAIAFPGFQTRINKSNASKAATYLRAIRLGEKMYLAHNFGITDINNKHTYYISCADAAAIKTNLGTEVDTSQYTFSVVASAPDITPPTFTATAAEGGNNANTITLDQNGTWVATGDQIDYKPTN
jgi:type IV pilus assembly protein PilE